jgi:hypothetical protein
MVTERSDSRCEHVARLQSPCSYAEWDLNDLSTAQGEESVGDPRGGEIIFAERGPER